MERETLRLADEVEELREELESVEAEAESLQREEADLDPVESEEDAERAEAIEDQWDSLEGRWDRLRSKLSGLESALDNWGGDGQFVVKELTYGELMRAKDEVTQNSYSVDGQGNLKGAPRDGFYKLKVLELAIAEAPDGAPDRPQEYPYHVGEWLYEAIDDLNTFGSPDEGNSSLRDTITSEGT